MAFPHGLAKLGVAQMVDFGDGVFMKRNGFLQQSVFERIDVEQWCHSAAYVQSLSLFWMIGAAVMGVGCAV